MKRRIPKAIQTANRVVMARKVVRKRIDLLKSEWRNLDNIQRGKLLNALLSRGCCLRGLGEKLEVPATTIRRYCTLAKLPKEERAALKAGETQKKALARKAERDRLRERNERIAEERKSGALSNELARIILDFLRTAGPLGKEPVWDTSIITLMTATKDYSRNTFGFRPTLTPLPQRLTLIELYQLTRPCRDQEEFELAYQARWLATILVSLAPEEEIRETAMEKAERDVWERGLSLDPKLAGLGLEYQVRKRRLSPLNQPDTPAIT
jgi:hypothetical protein